MFVRQILENSDVPANSSEPQIRRHLEGSAIADFDKLVENAAESWSLGRVIIAGGEPVVQRLLSSECSGRA